MTEKKANEIFRTKYPEGEIVRRNNSSAGNKFWVTFKSNGKVYYYACSTYAELLNKLGFKVVYRNEVTTLENEIRHYHEKLQNALNGEFDPFAFIFVERTEESEKEEINYIAKQLNEYKERLKYIKNNCIIEG